jgi:hypothetical protein
MKQKRLLDKIIKLSNKLAKYPPANLILITDPELIKAIDKVEKRKKK